MIARKTTLVIPKPAFARLHGHLYPGDGCEAAALMLCALVDGRRRKLLVCDIVEVPHTACQRRAPDFIAWPGEYVETAIDKAETAGLAIVAIHSHPGGYFDFSTMDDNSDRVLMPALFQGTGRECGSAIMIPGGAVRGRIYGASGYQSPIDLVLCPGDNLHFWWHHNSSATGPERPPVAFTAGMTRWLNQLSVCVIGVSGTGSIVAEQLARLGFGEIILIDYDKIEAKNLNRILNSTLADVTTASPKVEMFAKAIRLYRAGCDVIPVPHSVTTRQAVLAAAEADVVFSCVDTAEGRHIADRIGAFLAMPLFDLGVSIPTRVTIKGGREIAEVCGRIDYVQPGGSCLKDRGVYDAAMLEAEYLASVAPETHRKKVADGYLRGIAEQAPAVITLNMRAASACVMEFIARTFPFRHVSNDRRARTVFMLSDGEEEFSAERDFTATAHFPTGIGLQEPLLGLPALGKSVRQP